MKIPFVTLVLITLYGCSNKAPSTRQGWLRAPAKPFLLALEQAPLSLSNQNIFHLDTALNEETLQSYYKVEKDSLLDLNFDDHAEENWNNLKDLSHIDSTAFYFHVSNSTLLKTYITDRVQTGKYIVVFLHMKPHDSSPWSCGTCPGFSFILKYSLQDSIYHLDGTSGRVPYSFKYGRDITSFQIVDSSDHPYLIVTTDAGGVGQGREGVTIYSLNTLETLLFSKIFITGYRGVYFLPEDRIKVDWVLDALEIDTSTIIPGEIHINADLNNHYVLNNLKDSLTINRRGYIDYHVRYRDSNDVKRYIGDTINMVNYKDHYFLQSLD